MHKLFSFSVVAALLSLVNAQSALWGQCGGIGWTGATTCVSGASCVYSNAWYSQCLPSTTNPTTATTATTAQTTGTTTTTAGGTTTTGNGVLTQITGFGTNPTNVGMYIYVPKALSSSPALILAAHYCSGTAQAYYSGTQYANLAEQHNFIVIYPNAPTSGGCWDVHTTATLTHNSGGDSLGIASMIRWAQSKYGIPASKTFFTGSSSGAMMTNVFAGAYPDLFSAGVAFSGVPYACFEGTDAWSSACSTGTLIKTAAQWGDLVRAGYPGYTSTRPKMMFWHGSADTTLYPQNFQEEIKQWTNVFGVSATATTTTANSPASPWTKTTYGSSVVGYYGAGVGHPAPVNEAIVLQFFGIA